MGRPSYLIAKFVPDLFRNEPVNIGIIVWSEGATACRFVGATGAGGIDGRCVPGELKQALSSYKQWVEAWTRMLKKDHLKEIGKREKIIRSDLKFLDALQSTGRGNYILEQGGQLLEEVEGSKVDDVADYLFDRLVGSPTPTAPPKSAEEIREELLKEAQVDKSLTIERDKKIKVNVGQKSISHEFSMYIGNGKPAFLAQVMGLASQPKEVKKTADAFFARFTAVQASQNIPSNRCVVIVYSPDERDEAGLIDDSLTELESAARIVNLSSERPSLIQEIQAFVKESEEAGHD
jgi:hypothetical protein